MVKAPIAYKSLLQCVHRFSHSEWSFSSMELFNFCINFLQTNFCKKNVKIYKKFHQKFILQFCKNCFIFAKNQQNHSPFPNLLSIKVHKEGIVRIHKWEIVRIAASHGDVLKGNIRAYIKLLNYEDEDDNTNKLVEAKVERKRKNFHSALY